MNIQNKARKTIRKLPPISWGETQYDEKYINLKWGESPYSPNKNIISDITKTLKRVNRYPTLMSELKDRLAKYNKIDTNQICLVNGLDKAFRLISETFINSQDTAITFTPSYPVFDSSIKILDGKVVQIPLDKDFRTPKVQKIKKYIKDNTKLIYICNPNNPTGNFTIDRSQLEKILKLNLIVVLDEAYFEFSGKSYQDLLEKFRNLIILRSFSKTFGLAGLRVGYILSSAEITDYLRRIEESLEIFNIPTPSLAGAISALENLNTVKENIKKINQSREKLTSSLTKLGLKVYPSQTSFIMFNLKRKGIKAKEFIKNMEKEQVILKDISIYKGLSEYDAYMAVPRKDQIFKITSSIKKIISDFD